MKLRLLSSVVSSIISSIISIFLYKYYGDSNNNIIFTFVTSQQIAGIAIIFLLYGAQFEIKNKVRISAWKIILFSLLFIPFFPILSITCLLISRIALQKFGRIQPTKNSYKILSLILLLSIVIFNFKNNYYLILFLIIFISLIPILFIGESAFESPNFLVINWNILKAILLRSSLDLSLLFPMILINFITKIYFNINDYLEIQKLIFCLSGLAIATTIFEKIIFDNNLTKDYSKKFWRNNVIIFLITYIGVGLLAHIISIKADYWWFLIITPAINLIFTQLLSKIRFHLNINKCLKITLIYFLFTILFAILSAALYFTGLNPVNSIIISVICLSISQLVVLYFFF